MSAGFHLREIDVSSEPEEFLREWYALRKQWLDTRLPPQQWMDFESFRKSLAQVDEGCSVRSWMARDRETNVLSGVAELLERANDSASPFLRLYLSPHKTGLGVEQALWERVAPVASATGAERLSCSTWGMPGDPLEPFLRILAGKPVFHLAASAVDLTSRAASEADTRNEGAVPSLHGTPLHPGLLAQEFEEAVALGAVGLFDSDTDPSMQTYRAYREYRRSHETTTRCPALETILRMPDGRPAALASVRLAERDFGLASVQVDKKHTSPELDRACWKAVLEQVRLLDPPPRYLFSPEKNGLLTDLGLHRRYAYNTWSIPLPPSAARGGGDTQL